MNAGGTLNQNARRAAALYLTVFGTATIIAVVTLSALTTAHIRTKGLSAAENAAEAGSLAMSAMEHALVTLEAATVDGNPAWRTSLTSGQKAYTLSIGNGTAAWMLVDEGDGDLADDPSDSVRLYGIGTVGEAVRIRSVLLQATGEGLELLSTALHSAGQLHVRASRELTAIGAPLSTNDNLRNNGIIYGDVQALTQSGNGEVAGIVEIPAPAKRMPDPGVIDLYRGIATPIEYPGVIDGQVLARGYNPWGMTNPDGVYYIDTLGGNLVISHSHIYGTLVVDAPGKKVIVDDAAFLHPSRRDYPVLIVNGDVDIRLKSDLYGLRESVYGANFNPVGASYIEAPDDDQLDEYPNEIRGLVHATGTISISNAPRIKGVVISEASVDITTDGGQLEHDPSLATRPPMGYTMNGMVIPVRGTWRWDELP